MGNSNAGISPDQLTASKLSPRALLSQLLMIDFPGTAPSDSFLKEYPLNPWGGVILFTKNIQYESQLKILTGELRQIALSTYPHAPLLIAVDHEGGIVSRFSFPTTIPLCGNMALGASGDPQKSYEAARICAGDLLRLGINTNFAPCIDVNNNPANPIIGARSFGEDPGLVEAHGKAFVRGLQEEGIIAAAKHFPGHGDTQADSHSLLPTIPHSRDRLESIEIPPFRGAIEAKVGMIMTAHITFPALEKKPGLPATLSRQILTGYLRNELGFRGVIITDSMAMKAITGNFGYDEATIRAFEAGADMVLLCGAQEQQISALDALEGALEKGRIQRGNLEDSFMRLHALRRAIRAESLPVRSFNEDYERMRQITLSTITLVRNERKILPLRRDSRVLLVIPDKFPLSPLGEARIESTLPGDLRNYTNNLKVIPFSIKTGELPGMISDDEIESFEAVVFAAFCNGRLPALQKSIIERLLKMSRNLVVASLNSPYVLLDVPEVSTYINCYNYGDLSMEALAAILFGAHKPEGKLPVSLPGLYRAGHSIIFA